MGPKPARSKAGRRKLAARKGPVFQHAFLSHLLFKMELMPVISSFYGIDIKLYFRDHFPPHFHAFYGEFSAEISIHDLRVLAGGLPRRAMSLVGQWVELHRAELLAEWEKAWNGVHPDRIEPLP